jgi:hypothetical protein
MEENRVRQTHPKPRWTFSVILALVLIVCVQACGSSGTRSSSDSRSRTDFQDKTETKITTMEVRSVMTSNDLRVRVDLTEGAASWTLTDPAGDVRWEEEIVAPARWNELREFEPVVGEWTLKLSLENATGGYDVHWQASN